LTQKVLKGKGLMAQINLRWRGTSVSVYLAGVVAVALFCPSLFAGEGEVKQVQTTKPATVESKCIGGARMLTMERTGNGFPWVDLAVIIEDVEGGIKVAGTILLPEDFPRAASLEEGALIKTFQNKAVTTAADMIAQYDKLKTGDTVALSFELKGQTGLIKFVKPKPVGNCVMIKK
jgi:hypothetical protein